MLWLSGFLLVVARLSLSVCTLSAALLCVVVCFVCRRRVARPLVSLCVSIIIISSPALLVLILHTYYLKDSIPIKATNKQRDTLLLGATVLFL